MNGLHLGWRMSAALPVILAVAGFATDTRAAPEPCNPPISYSSTENPVVVGVGSTASCTEAALRSAITQATTTNRPVTFDCGGPATILLTATIELPTGRNFTIDGGGQITLDGGGAVRLFRYEDNTGWRSQTAAMLVFQRITLSNGAATGPLLAVQGTGICSYGYELTAGGGAIWSRNARLRLIDAAFLNNHAAEVGPDVAGGAVYSIGSIETTVVGCRFEGNIAANGGAIGVLWGGLSVYNSDLNDNRAAGHGGNNDLPNSGCPQQANGQHQVGTGGLGGAIYADGGDPRVLRICGSRMMRNQASHLGGAIFRVGYNIAGQGLDIDRSTFADNVCEGRTAEGVEEGGAGGVYTERQTVSIRASAFVGNRAYYLGGGLRVESAPVTVENCTFFGNSVTRGLGGAIFWGGSSTGAITNCTIAGNTANGGVGFFGGAIADPAGTSITGLSISNTLLAFNSTDDPYNGMQCQRTVGNGNWNLQWPRVRDIGGADDTPCVQGIVFADPQLGPLVEGDGTTPWLAPAGPDYLVQVGQNCPATDQRGAARATPCTVGAVERGASNDPPPTIIAYFPSIGPYDGWVRETMEASGRGGYLNARSVSFRVGDDSLDRQYRMILAFDTSTLPADAVILYAKLRVRYRGKVGTNPFATHGRILVDAKLGAFSNNVALQIGDFRAKSTKAAAAKIRHAPVAGWYATVLAPDYINMQGYTQLRLRFARKDNDDRGADYLLFYSGNADDSVRPVLEVVYHTP